MSLQPNYPTAGLAIEKYSHSLALLCPFSRKWNDLITSDLTVNSFSTYTICPLRITLLALAIITIIPMLYVHLRSYKARDGTLISASELKDRFYTFERTTPTIELRDTETKGLPNASFFSSNPVSQSCYRNCIISVIANVPALHETFRNANIHFYSPAHKRNLYDSLMRLIELQQNEDADQGDIQEAAETFGRYFQEALEITRAQNPDKLFDLEPGIGRHNNSTSFINFLADQFGIDDFRFEKLLQTSGFLQGNCNNRRALNSKFLIADNSFNSSFHLRDTMFLNGRKYELCGVTNLSMRHYTGYVRMRDGSYTKFNDTSRTRNTTDNFRKGSALAIYQRVNNSIFRC